MGVMCSVMGVRDVILAALLWITWSQDIDESDPSLQVVLSFCPDNIHVSTERGHPYASVWWNEPIFTSISGQRWNPTKSHVNGQRFPLGDTTVLYTLATVNPDQATDVNCAFQITVVDTEAPTVVSCPSTFTTTANHGQAFASGVRWEEPVFEDNVAVEEMDSTHHGDDIQFPIGRTEVTYTAEDEAGNSGTCTFNVTVVDIEAPVIVNCPLDIIAISKGSSTSRKVDWQIPTPRDNSGYVKMTSEFNPGHRFELGRTTVSYVAQDKSQNRALCTFSVFIKASVPENRIYIRAVTTDSLKLAWPETTDNRASSYLIYIWNAKDGEPEPYEHLYQVTDRTRAIATRTVTSLLPGEVYNIRVVVTGSSSSINIQQRTLPHPPSSLLCEEADVTPTSFQLRWTPGEGTFQRYHMTIRGEESPDIVFERNLDKSETTATVTGLEPDTSYACALRALSGGIRDGTESEVVTLNLRTKILPPLTLQAMKTTSSSLKVIFNFPPEKPSVLLAGLRAHHGRYYESSQAVFLYNNGKEAFADTAFPTVDGTSRFTFGSLAPLENYTVKAIDNESGRILQANFFTEPPEVTGLRAVYVSDTSFIITWYKIDIQGIVYEIDLSPRPTHMEERITTYINKCQFDHLVTMETYVVTLSTVYGNYRSFPKSLRVVPGIDNVVDFNHFGNEGPCMVYIVVCAVLLFFSLTMAVYILALCCCGLPRCLIPSKARGPFDENTYEVPVSLVIDTVKDPLPSFRETDCSKTLDSRDITPCRFQSMRGNLYNNRTTDNTDSGSRKYMHCPGRPKATRTQSARVPPRLQRSSSMSALYLNMRRLRPDEGSLMDEEFESTTTDFRESLLSYTESIMWSS